MTKTREDAWTLVNEFTKNKNLVKHMLAVEAGMAAYARHFGADAELWRIVGLLHDFDYEKHQIIPDHPLKGAAILRERGWPDEIVDAILSHADESGVPRDTQLRKALYAVDELTGLIVAVALVRPTKDIRDVDVSAVKKKWGEKRFAAGVNRAEIEAGTEALGVPLDEHIQRVLDAMQGIAGELGLDGR
ncbi:MAG: HDIG domain-containing metalloprotein [Anaerolineae bacterium]